MLLNHLDNQLLSTEQYGLPENAVERRKALLVLVEMAWNSYNELVERLRETEIEMGKDNVRKATEKGVGKAGNRTQAKRGPGCGKAAGNLSEPGLAGRCPPGWHLG